MEKCCVRVGLRQRPFVREWLRICVSYNIVVQWRGRNGPGVEGPPRIHGKRNTGRRDICTERGMKILSVGKYAWDVHEHRKIEPCLRKKKISYRRSVFFEIAKRSNTLIHCACIAAVDKFVGCCVKKIMKSKVILKIPPLSPKKGSCKKRKMYCNNFKALLGSLIIKQSNIITVSRDPCAIFTFAHPTKN